MQQGKMHYAWFILLGVILIRGFAGGGVNMTSSLFLPSVSSELGVGIGSISIYFSIISIVMVFWLPIAGKLIHRFDIRIMALAGAVLQTFSFMGFGFMSSVYGWYVLAVPYAMGATVLVNLLGPILINRWFTKNKGMMMGIQMAFVGLFGAVLQPFASMLIAEKGWRIAYWIIGGVTFVAVLISAFLFLRSRPREKGLVPFGIGEEEYGNSAEIREGFSVGEGAAVRSASFYLLLFFMVAITGVGVFTQHIPSYGAILGYSIQRIGMALSFASVGSAIGSIAIGMISDRIGVLKTCYGILAIGGIAVLGFSFSGESFVLFASATFLHGLTSSGVMVLAPVLTLTFYGQKDYERIYARISMGAPLASILLVPAYGFIYDEMRSYTIVLIGILFLLIFAAFCIAMGWRKRCTIDGCPGWKGIG